jgi:hypothetical protein
MRLMVPIPGTVKVAGQLISSVYIPSPPSGNNDVFVREDFPGMLPSAESPLARLVLFMICLAIAGSFVAGVHYYGVERPQQEALRAAGLNPPSNFCMCRNLNCDPYGRGYCPPCHQGDNNCVCSCSDT